MIDKGDSPSFDFGFETPGKYSAYPFSQSLLQISF